MNKRELFQFWHSMDESMHVAQSAFPRIRQFYTRNKHIADGVKKDVHQLTTEYFQFEDGVMLMNEDKPIPLEGKSIQEYQMKLAQLMDQKILLNV